MYRTHLFVVLCGIIFALILIFSRVGVFYLLFHDSHAMHLSSVSTVSSIVEILSNTMPIVHIQSLEATKNDSVLAWSEMTKKISILMESPITLEIKSTLGSLDRFFVSINLNGCNDIGLLSTQGKLNIHSHYAITLIVAGQANPILIETISSSIFNYLTSISEIVSLSLNTFNHDIQLPCNRWMMQSDVIDQFTSRSESLWNMDYCSENENSSCENFVLVVHVSDSYCAIVDDGQSGALLSTNNSFLLPLGGTNSWGSYVTVKDDASGIEDAQNILLTHLQRMLHLPTSEQCSETFNMTKSVDSKVIKIGPHSPSILNEHDLSVLHWSMIKNSLIELNRKASVIRGLFIERNALLWYDIVTNCGWLQAFKQLSYLMKKCEEDLVEILPLLEFERVEVEWKQPYSEAVQAVIDALLVQRSVSVPLKLIAQVQEAHRIATDLYDDPFSRYSGVGSSHLAIEEYFAVFAPFWLPILAPVVKSVKLLFTL